MSAIDALIDQMVNERLEAAIAAKLAALPMSTIIESTDDVDDEPAEFHFTGTVSKVAAHLLGLQMTESKARYWNVAKSVRDTVNYDGISEGMVVRLSLDRDPSDGSARVLGWLPVHGTPTKGSGSKTAQTAKTASKAAPKSNGKAQAVTGAAKAAPAPKTESKAEMLTRIATERMAAYRAAKASMQRTSKSDPQVACPFCGAVHFKYTAEQVTTACLSRQYDNETGAPLDVEQGTDWIAFGQWLASKQYRVVFSLNAQGFTLLEQDNFTGEAAPAASAPTIQRCGDCGTDLRTHVRSTRSKGCPTLPKVSSPAPTSQGKPAPEKPRSAPSPEKQASAASAANTERKIQEDPKQRREIQEPLKKTAVAADSAPASSKGASATDVSFRAIITAFPTKKIGMVKLSKYDGSGETWYDYDLSLDIARCAVGSVVDCSVRYERSTQSKRLVAYTLVSKPATTAGIENSGKQQPAAKPVKHVTNRQRNEARKHQEAKTEKPALDEEVRAMGKCGAPKKDGTPCQWNITKSPCQAHASKKQEAAPAASAPKTVVDSPTDDIDAVLAAAGAKNKAKGDAARAKREAQRGKDVGIPGIRLQEDAKGIPVFVVENAPKRKRASKKDKKPVGLVTGFCSNCDRRMEMPMVGYSPIPGLCGICFKEEANA